MQSTQLAKYPMEIESPILAGGKTPVFVGPVTAEYGIACSGHDGLWEY